MTRAEFYNKLNDNAAIIQAVAAGLAKNHDDAHKLYLETIHQATKNLGNAANHQGFKAWLVITMRNVFWKNFRYSA